eukprot:UN06918
MKKRFWTLLRHFSAFSHPFETFLDQTLLSIYSVFQ